MGKPNPFPFSARVDDLRIVLADRGVQQNRRAYFVSVERFHHPPDADAYAIIPPTVVEWIWREHRRPAKDACRWFVDLEMLDVQADVKCDPRTVRPSELWPADDRRIAIELIVHCSLSLTDTAEL